MEKTNKELRYALLQATRYDVEQAKHCYDFVQGKLEPFGETEPESRQEGIYLIYDDGRVELFTGTNGQNGVKYVGVVFRGISFAVSLTETDAALLPDDAKATKRPNFYKSECKGIYDFNSKENTERLLQDNPKLAELLGDGEAIPALGVLEIMCYLRKGINKALDYVGGHLLTDTWYWSSAENSESIAWYVNFSNGLTDTYYKCYSFAVRAVAAF